MHTTYIEHIKQMYPSLPIESYEKNDIGQNNDVLIVNDAYVFRFPKYQKGITRLQEEMEILKYIQQFISVQTPHFIYHSFDNFEIGKVFTGYPLIEGEPLWKWNSGKADDEVRSKAIASQLVEFLIELHSIPVSSNQPEVLSRMFKNDPLEEMLLLHNNIQEKLHPFIKIEKQKELDQSFEKFQKNGAIMRDKLTIIHGDFGASNIIWNPKTAEITGIIDFGSARIGDPAYDFAGILSSYGEQFFNLCISLYPNGDEIVERVKFYKSTFALQEALHGIDNNDQQAFEDGMKDYI